MIQLGKRIQLIKRKLNKNEIKVIQPVRLTEHNSNQLERERNEQLKLPKLELKRFDGNISEWLPFWEQYSVSIHENKVLTPATKFNYLQSLLMGKAALSIKGFTPTEKCYNDAIQLLKEQFGNSEKIVEKHINDLMTVQAIQGKDIAYGLRKLYNRVTINMRSLDALNVPANQYERMLKTIILKSLPTEIRTEFYRKESNGESEYSDNESMRTATNVNLENTSNLENLLKFIKRELEALEMSAVGMNKKEDDNKVKYTKNQRESTDNMTTAAGLLTTNTNASEWNCETAI